MPTRLRVVKATGPEFNPLFDVTEQKGGGATYVQRYENDPLQLVDPPLAFCETPLLQSVPVTFLLQGEQGSPFKFNIGDDDITIRDDEGNAWMKIDGKRQGVFRRKWAGQLEDLRGNPLLYIQPKVNLLGKPCGDYDMYQGETKKDKLVCTVDGNRSESPTFLIPLKSFGKHEAIHVVSQLMSPKPNYHIKYYVFLGDPDTEGAQLIGKVDFQKKYTIAVAPGVDLAFMVALTWSIDQACELWVHPDHQTRAEHKAEVKKAAEAKKVAEPKKVEPAKKAEPKKAAVKKTVA